MREDGAVVDIETIQKKTAEHYRIDPAELCGKRRTATIALARQIAMYISRKLTTHTLQEIGKHFGGRDHGTVIHAMKLIEHLVEHDDSIKRAVEFLMKSLSV